MLKLSRRQLLRLGGTGALAGGALGTWLWRGRDAEAQRAEPRFAPNPQPHTPPTLLPLRELGATGQKVTIFGLGGASAKTPLSNGPHEEAVRIIERALELGVSYFDTADSYGNGESERALGEAAKTRRSAMFLASKTGARSYDGAMRALEGSLARLQTDYLDLWQMHAVSLEERDTRPAFGPDGAIKALQKAVDEKVVRFAGVSGHHRTDVLADWLRRYPFDTLLATINAIDRHHPDSFIERLLPLAAEKKLGVIAMKIPAYGRLLRPAEGVTIRDAFNYSLSQPHVSCGIIACDSIAMLEENVSAARDYAPMTKEAQAELERKTASNWQQASFYRSWT